MREKWFKFKQAYDTSLKLLVSAYILLRIQSQNYRIGTARCASSAE